MLSRQTAACLMCVCTTFTSMLFLSVPSVAMHACWAILVPLITLPSYTRGVVLTMCSAVLLCIVHAWHPLNLQAILAGP